MLWRALGEASRDIGKQYGQLRLLATREPAEITNDVQSSCYYGDILNESVLSLVDESDATHAAIKLDSYNNGLKLIPSVTQQFLAGLNVIAHEPTPPTYAFVLQTQYSPHPPSKRSAAQYNRKSIVEVSPHTIYHPSAPISKPPPPVPARHAQQCTPSTD